MIFDRLFLRTERCPPGGYCVRSVGIVGLLIFAAMLALASATTECAAQQPTLITNIDHRHSTSLNGDWHIIVDPYDNGYYDYRYQPRGDGYFENRKASSKSDLVEYDFSRSETLKVPGDWNTQRPELFLYEGTVWYERDFDFHPKAGTRAFLHIGAANYVSHAYVNGTKVCDHEGGYTPFDCEITKVVHDGSNFVVIFVNDQRHKEDVPTLNTDWWNYGGLTRDVSIVEVPDTFIDDAVLQLARGSRSHISGWVHVDAAAAAAQSALNDGAQIKVSIPELRIEKTATVQEGKATFDFEAPGLTLWSPEHPKLYKVKFSSGADSMEDEIGFRSIQTRGTQILLNGKPIFLKGVAIHAEAPFRTGRANTEADAETLLGWVKELGGNYARLAHYPHDERMVRLADKMGILIWSEVPVYWTIDWTNPATLANAKQQVREMVLRDRDRASVILWSVANETPILPERMAFLKQLIATVREEDSTRLVTAALQTRSTGKIRMLNDPLGADLDVFGCNEYIGWYEGKPEDADKTTWQSSYSKPLIMSEFGAGAKAGMHGDADTRWTEEYQARVYQHQLIMLKRIPFLAGMSPWVLMDFRSPRRPLPGIQDFFNRKGLLSEKGRRKKAFYVLQKFYRGTPLDAGPNAAPQRAEPTKP